MSIKRTLLSTSPDNINCTPKKIFTGPNMSTGGNQDLFSWSKLGDLLDDKLRDVAKKEDVAAIKQEVDVLKTENSKLKDEIQKLTNRLEVIDRRSRSSNVVVSGLVCNNTSTAKKMFISMSKNELNVDINIMGTKMLSSGKSFVFTLETQGEAQRVIEARRQLKGKNIYIQKDYTALEQTTRYNLRKVARVVSKIKPNIKVRLGEFCIFVNDIKYTWMDEKILAPTQKDADFLVNILELSNNSYDVFCKQTSNINNINENSSSQ